MKPSRSVPYPPRAYVRVRSMTGSRRARTRGGVLGWLSAALVFGGAVLVLAWMLLLPGLAQTRFSAATGGAELRLQGLMGDPFAGRATVTGWTLRASSDPKAPVLARGAASEIVSTDWRSVLGMGDAPKGAIVIDKLVLHAAELVLAPDAKGRWPLLALGASVGLPYERGGKTGGPGRARVKNLQLSVDTVVVRDAASGRDKSVRVDWRGEFRDLDHSRPVVAALLAAAAGRQAAP